MPAVLTGRQRPRLVYERITSATLVPVRSFGLKAQVTDSAGRSLRQAFEALRREQRAGWTTSLKAEAIHLPDLQRLTIAVVQPDDSRDSFFMGLAFEEAKEAGRQGEVPIGAVLVYNDTLICQAQNRMEASRDPTLHAEMQVIREAAATLGRFKLPECTLYVTLEPCPMCAGAMLQARVGAVVYGARNTLLGADGSWIELLRAGVLPKKPTLEDGGAMRQAHQATPARPHPFHPSIQVRTGVLAEECAALMKNFFKQRRLDPPR